MYSKKLSKIKSAILSGMIAAASVAGSFSAVAPAVNANAAGSDDYAKLLQYSLYFYDANMCGSEVGETSGLTWRDDCHTGDEVNGGFHDAGDHAMFGLPQGYSASTLGWSYYEFKDAYNATGQASHLKTISDYFCKFFKDSTKLDGNGNVTNFLYQKGDGDVDHSYWGAPEKQEQEQGVRKMFWTSNGASDIAAEYAAALAVNYINFGNAEDLKYAEALYKFSTQYNQVATDGPTGFYNSSSCQDEQAWAAGWLYLATNNENYKNDCASKQTKYLGWVHGWNTADLGAACIYAEITGNWNDVNSYIEKTINEKTQNGYLFMDPWGSARYNCSMQMTALVATKHSSADYTEWCKGQMNYITGDNPSGICLITGFDSNSAKNTHHRAASGYQGYEGEYGMNENTTQYHPSAGHVLIGALAGGPEDANGTYSDVMNNYKANEVAIDYNAGLVGAAAGLYDVYKTGSTVSSIEGVDKIYNSSVTPPATSSSQTTKTTQSTTQTTQTTATPANEDVVLLPSDMKVGTEEGTDGEMNNYAEFDPQGAKSATLYYKVNSNDTNTSGAFGTWTGTWEQVDFEGIAVPSNKVVTVDYTIPSNVGSTVKAMVFWPHGNNVTIEKVVLHKGNGSVQTTQSTQTTPSTPSGSGSYEVKLNQKVDYSALPKDDKMIGWNWSDFNLPSNAKPTKVEIKISANGNIGKWQGAFGSSTKVEPDYWTQTDDMEQTFNGNSGTITWNINSATSDIIQTQYGGELKFGIWWIDCGTFTIDSITVYTDGASSQPTTQSTTKSTTQTTKTTTKTTTVTPSGVIYGDANEDGIVDIADAAAIIQHIGNKDRYGLSAQGAKNADCYNNGDGVTGMDAITIQKIEAGMLSASNLPVRE